MSALPLPVINEDRCTGCGICVSLCPTTTLALREQRAILAAPERCTYCSACEDVCPEDAIALPFLIVFGRRRLVDDPLRS